MSGKPRWLVRWPTGLAMVVWTIVLALGGLGCHRAETGHGGRSTGMTGADTASGQALFKNVAERLNHLDRDIDLQLRPPVVVLDASKSSDHHDVLATLGENPRNPRHRFEFLRVPKKNSQFQQIGVRPGDRIRFFVSDPGLAAQITVIESPRFQQRIKQGQPVDEQLMQSWVNQALQERTGSRYFEMPVWRVVGESELLVEGGLPLAVTTPERLEIWRYGNERMRAIARRFRYYIRGPRGVLGWEPSPDEAVLEQVVEHLNQWLRKMKPTGTWASDPLVQTLPDSLRRFASAKSLAALSFRPYDGRLLQESIWLRDIARWARGEQLGDLPRATHLFDWCVRNIQLELPGALHYRPWQTLLLGRGTAAERAWVFMLLCRQQGLDAVMLARPDPEQPGQWIDWIPALFTDDKLYLFDPWLGVPIPGTGGQGVATLAQAATDDHVLRQLDLDAKHAYPVRAADLKDVLALVAASPDCLSRRMGLLESHLAGDKKMALTSRPSALAGRLRHNPRITAVRLWELPYQTIRSQLRRDARARQQAADQFQLFAWEPVLWKARVLHFQGTFDGDQGAKTYYRKARLADSRIKAMAARAAQQTIRTIRFGKICASYWLGLLTYDNGQTGVAIDYFDRRTVQADPSGPWIHGARYNLGRAYERAGRLDRAKQLYRDDPSPQQHGNRLRARWLDAHRTPSARAAPLQPTPHTAQSLSQQRRAAKL